jgi:hypothetical protein
MTTETRTRYVVTTTKGEKVVERSTPGMGAVPAVGNVLWVEGSSNERTWYEIRSITLGFPRADAEYAIHIVAERIERKPQLSSVNPPSMQPVGAAQRVDLPLHGIHNFDDGLTLAVQLVGDDFVYITPSERGVPAKTDSTVRLEIGQQAQFRSISRGLLWIVTMIACPEQRGGKAGLSVECFSYK